MKSCLELLFEGSQSLDKEAFCALWKKLNCPMDKFEKVMDYVLGTNEEAKVTVDAVCKYFDEDPQKLVARRKRANC